MRYYPRGSEISIDSDVAPPEMLEAFLRLEAALPEHEETISEAWEHLARFCAARRTMAQEQETLLSEFLAC